MVDLFEISRTGHVTAGPPDSPSGFLDNSSYFPIETSSIATTPDVHVCIPSSQVPPDTLAFADGYPVTERAKRTASLFGTKFVEPHKIHFPREGQKQILFTFSVSSPYVSDQPRVAKVKQDLAVRLEGYFILRLAKCSSDYRVLRATLSRYRFFDIFCSPPGQGSSPILAECYGGSFRIYSSKEAPSLGESTALTKV